MASTPKGKGFFIWKIPNSEGGKASAITTQAQNAGYTHILIKIADGTASSNYDTARATDLIPPVRNALKAVGIQVWGWHYVYGYDPLGEARKAIQRLQDLNLDGYVIDAEVQYKEPGKATAAAKFMTEMRAAFPSLPMALSSFRYPSYHPQLPWKQFLEKCDFNMPQVYWEQAHNPVTQLTRSVNEFKALSPFRPIIPTGPAYKTGGWAPTETDINDFLKTASSLGLSAANFFSWEECRRDLPAIWNTIARFNWATAGRDISERYIAALNSHDANQVVNLYQPSAVQITASRTIQGTDQIRNWYMSLINDLLPNASFVLTSMGGIGNSRNFTWQATSTKGTVTNGRDTLGLLQDKINYHYSYFTVTN